MSGYVPNDRGKRPAPVVEPYNGNFDQQPPRPLIVDKPSDAPVENAPRVGCVFAKSCSLPTGVINYSSPSDFVPLDALSQYGDWAILGGRQADSSGAIPLSWIGGIARASALTTYFGGGSLSLSGAATAGTGATAAGGATGAGMITAGVVSGALLGLVGMLIPRSTAADDVFYTEEQIRQLPFGRTRARLNVKQLPDGSVSAYGFYTGKNPEWEMVPVIKAQPRGNQYVADLGNGIGLTWTPAVNPGEVLGIPALEGAPQVPAVWVHPPGEQADRTLVNPVHPPEYQDAIIWFPATAIKPIYVVLSVPGGHEYYPAPKGLAAFPDAQVATRKTPVKGGGGLRKRWKARDGSIFEWDSQHGAVEKYNKRGKHLGEFNPETGEQTKPADNTREVEP